MSQGQIILDMVMDALYDLECNNHQDNSDIKIYMPRFIKSMIQRGYFDDNLIRDLTKIYNYDVLDGYDMDKIVVAVVNGTYTNKKEIKIN